uniref:Polycystic kidney disease protein 1-like 2-like n=1 Tax=Saccoglossus kowalevskii TaxID=10224 RepID=A0ABM0M662_SACKO|nr:PREDICTED: polycystic kidney disease protein 1-like 2-like [Saccoglossus kowalevskii]
MYIMNSEGVFQRGSVCNFLLTVPRSLGDLETLRIWHNNNGKAQHASWYLNKIVVHDVHTQDNFVFLCDRWLAVEEDDGRIRRHLRVTNEREMKNFNHLFASNARAEFTDGHIWFSIVSRPTRSHFTRVQRLSCCLSLLYTAMIANCMWYKAEGSDLYQNIIDVGPFSFTWHSIYVGFMSSLVVFPVNIVLIQLFRKSRPYTTRLASPRIDVTHSDPNDNDHDVVEDEVYATLKNKNRLSFDSRDLVYGTSRKSLSFHGSNIPRYVSAATDTRIDEREKKMYFVNNPDHSSEDSDESADDAGNETPGKRKPAKNTSTPFMLPHWCVYIAWCLVLLSSTASAFFTILYSMEWGNDKSVHWLVSFITSFFQSLFVIQPIKVVLLALVLAIVYKTPDSPHEANLNVELLEDIKVLQKASDKKETEHVNIDQHSFMPPDPKKLEEARRERMKERRMCALAKDIVIYCLFLLIIYIIAYSNRDYSSHYYHKSIDDTFFQNKYFRNLESTGFEGLGTWVTTVLLPQLYPTEMYNGDSLSWQQRRFISDLSSYRIGSPRLRQLRVRPGLCTVMEQFSSLNMTCNPEYSYQNYDYSSYNEFWTVFNDSAVFYDEVWNYQSSDELESLPLYGVQRLYYGGGYVAELGTSLKEALFNWNYLWQSKWFDRHTRALFVEFSLFNANVNLFSMVTLLIEFPATGAAIVFPKNSVLRLYHHVGSFGTFFLFCEVIFVGFVISFLLRECFRIKEQKWNYLKNFWNLTEIVRISLCVTVITMYTYQTIFWDLALNKLSGDGPQSFVNLQRAAAWDELFVYILSVILFISFIRLINLLRFNSRISLLSFTLQHAAKDFVYYGIKFFVVMCAYGQVFFIVIGGKVGYYKTFTSTIETLLSIWLGVFDYQATYNASRVLGPILFFTFSLFMYAILTSMFISIIIWAFLDAKVHCEKLGNEYEMMDFLTRNIAELLGIHGEDGDDDDKEGNIAEKINNACEDNKVKPKTKTAEYTEVNEKQKAGTTNSSSKPRRKSMPRCLLESKHLDDLEERVMRMDECLNGFKSILTWEDYIEKKMVDYMNFKTHLSSDREESIQEVIVYVDDNEEEEDTQDDTAVNPRVGVCELCKTRLSTNGIESHLMLQCASIQPFRTEMLRNMIEVIEDIPVTRLRDKALSWWQFYRENCRHIDLTYTHNQNKALRIGRDSMRSFDLPLRIQRRLSRVVAVYLERALEEPWCRLKEKSERFNLYDFVV